MYINIKTTMMLHVPLVCARTVEKSSQISFVTLVEQLIIQCDDTGRMYIYILPSFNKMTMLIAF